LRDVCKSKRARAAYPCHPDTDRRCSDLRRGNLLAGIVPVTSSLLFPEPIQWLGIVTEPGGFCAIGRAPLDNAIAATQAQAS